MEPAPGESRPTTVKGFVLATVQKLLPDMAADGWAAAAEAREAEEEPELSALSLSLSLSLYPPSHSFPPFVFSLGKGRGLGYPCAHKF